MTNHKTGGNYFFGAPCMLQAYCSPQSRAPHRASTNLQLKLRLPMLLFTLLCTRQVHCCSSCPDDTLGGSFLHDVETSTHAEVLCICHRRTQKLQHTCSKSSQYLLDNFVKVLSTLCARVYTSKDVHLHASELSRHCCTDCHLRRLRTRTTCT